MNACTYDHAIIGAGIVGLATAYELSNAGRRVVVVDKEDRVASHQSSRNSGVLHTGVYYAPGSAKARNCRAGYTRMLAFCRDEGIPHALCGKVIVATNAGELEGLERVFERGKANGVRVQAIGPEELAEIEPFARGVAALHVPDAGVTSYGSVATRLAERIRQGGSELRLGVPVVAAKRSDGVWRLELGAETVTAAHVVNCAGLFSDRVARIFGVDPGLRIVPFRGEYHRLSDAAAERCRGLIYPVPDPRFPFLGVHLTRGVDGVVEAGPNAVLALAREGYRWRDVSGRDAFESLTDPGFVRLAARHWPTGIGEVYRSLSRAAFARAASKLVPGIGAADLSRAPAGVRAQALNPDGTLVDDFRIVRGEGSVHVCNAPSPAATSSLAIGAHVRSLIEDEE